MSWASLVPPGADRIVQQVIEDLQRTGVCTPFELNCIHKTGRRIPVLITAALLDGSRNRGVCIHTDLTDAYEGVGSLKEMNSMLLSLLDQLPSPAFVKDGEARYQVVNAPMTKLIGLSPEEILGKTAEELHLPHTDRASVSDQRVLLTGECNTTDSVINTGGKERLIRFRKSPLRDSVGQITGILGFCTDMTEILLQEKETRETREQFKLISKNVAEGIVIRNTDGSTVFSNLIAQSMLSFPHDWLTLEGLPIPEKKRPDYLALATGEEVEALMLLRYKELSGASLASHNGTQSEDRWIFLKVIPLKNSSDGLTGTLNILRDVSEIRKLEDLNQLQKASMRASMDGISIQNAKGEFLHVNEAHTALYGYSMKELLGKSWELLYEPAEAERIHAEILPKFKTLGSWRGETVARKKNGSLFFQELSLTTFGADGVVCVIRDITDRKRNHAARKIFIDIEKKISLGQGLDVILRAISQNISTYFAEWCLIDLSVSRNELHRIAQTHRDPSNDHSPIQTGQGALIPVQSCPAIAKALESGETVFIPEGANCRDVLGDSSPAGLQCRSMLIVPIIYRGQSLGSIVLARDTLPRFTHQDVSLAESIALRTGELIDGIKLRESARAAVSSREDFISMVSHDLKNPLSAMLLNAAFLIRTIDRKAEGATETETQIKKQLANLERSAQHMTKLLNDFVDLARIESGGIQLEKQEYRIPTLIRETIEDLAPLASAKAQTVETSIRLTQETAVFDRERIGQVFTALLTNAIRFAPEKGLIRVSAEQGNGEILFSIIDNGPGIPEQSKQGLFERYREIQAQTRLNYGVGLPLSKGLIEAHGGKLWLEDRPGPGALFRFTIPIHGEH